MRFTKEEILKKIEKDEKTAAEKLSFYSTLADEEEKKAETAKAKIADAKREINEEKTPNMKDLDFGSASSLVFFEENVEPYIREYFLDIGRLMTVADEENDAELEELSEIKWAKYREFVNKYSSIGMSVKCTVRTACGNGTELAKLIKML